MSITAADPLTKADVVGRYELVGDAMAPFLHNRPLTLQRFPKQTRANGFICRRIQVSISRALSLVIASSSLTAR